MEGSITFYDREGVPLAEVAGVAPRSWMLNMYGQAKIRLALSSYQSAEYPNAPLTEQTTQIGNLVLVRHDRAGDWVGVLALPRSWDEAAGEVELTAYTPEWLLRYRIGEARLRGTRGQVFAQLMTHANVDGGPLFRVGGVERGGASIGVSLGKQPSLYDVLVGKLAGERAGNDWGITPAFTEDGRLYFEGHWYGTRGVQRPNVALIEGHNLRLPSGAMLVEDGEIVNRTSITGEKDPSKNGLGKKPRDAASDATSVAAFGVFEQRLFSDSNDQATLEEELTTFLTERAQPRRRFTVEVLDVNNAFDIVQLGDVIPLQLVRAGFSGGQLGTEAEVRVMGKSFDETEGYLSLVVEESIL